MSHPYKSKRQPGPQNVAILLLHNYTLKKRKYEYTIEGLEEHKSQDALMADSVTPN